MDERVVYLSQVDLQLALAEAKAKFDFVHQRDTGDHSQLPKLSPFQQEIEALKLQIAESKALEAVAREATNHCKSLGSMELKVLRDAPLAPEMVVLPSGKFLMGSLANEPGRLYDEDPQHEVAIGYRLAMGRYPVTFDEWDACFADGGTDWKPDDEGDGHGRKPIVNVSWTDAQQYVKWLNNKVGLNVDDPSRYRLATESEWEYACRAGTTGMFSTPDGLMSAHWANYDATEVFEGAPQSGVNEDESTNVGSFPANPWGLFDMHGNVLEWVQDTYVSDYNGVPVDGSARQGDSGQPFRVLRGGSWTSEPRELRSACRAFSTPDYRFFHIGFRVVRTLT